MGETLELGADSLFTFKTCGHIIQGHWTDTGGNILLSPSGAALRVDSLSDMDIPLDSVPFYKDGLLFKRRGDALTRELDGRLEKLIKMNKRLIISEIYIKCVWYKI